MLAGVKRALPAGVAARVLLVVSCASACTGGGSTSVLQSSDLTAGSGFDASELVPLTALQDAATLDAAHVSAFLAATPYGHASFLSSYASHGQSAASSIVSAAQAYALNPLLFLVRAEMDQGLVGAASYPSPAARVEFAFGCGCAAPGQCDAAYEGFDVQVRCLGAALRQSLDAVAARGKTDGGWGPGLPSTTLDGVRVTPRDASTAALYQYTPVVALGQPGGNWLLWNLWQRYAGALGYHGPTTAPSSWIGDACSAGTTCAYEGTPGTCATQFPGGLCTLACTGTCPSQTGKAGTFCADFGTQGGFCLSTCDPSSPTCRAGYTCKSVKQVGDTASSQNVCFP